MTKKEIALLEAIAVGLTGLDQEFQRFRLAIEQLLVQFQVGPAELGEAAKIGDIADEYVGMYGPRVVRRASKEKPEE